MTHYVKIRHKSLTNVWQNATNEFIVASVVRELYSRVLSPKAVLLLSTEHHAVFGEPTNYRTGIILHRNKIKRPLDTTDKMVKQCSARQISNPWTWQYLTIIEWGTNVPQAVFGFFMLVRRRLNKVH